MRSQSATITITRAVTVAAGVFAPGHLGELRSTCRSRWSMTSWRGPRRCSGGCGICRRGSGCTSCWRWGCTPRLGYARVWPKLTAGLAGLPVPYPSEKALAETGTRGLPGAALGSAADRDEATVARRLLALLHPGMLILLDRAFDANAFLRQVAATGALLVARARSTRHPVVPGHLPDGSYLSDLGGLAVRVIEAMVTVTGAGGSRVRTATG